MMGIKPRNFHPIEAVTLEHLVPADHFYRHLDHTLDLSFVRNLVRGYYAAGGRPSIDPVVFFRLQLVMFFEGIRSERQLMAVAADRLSLRWYLGYDLDEPLPDHSSLTRIRERFGLETLQRFFEHITAQCQAAGLVWGVELYFDATKVRANADLDTLIPRFAWNMRQHLATLFADASDGAGTDAPNASVGGDTPSADGVVDLPARHGSPDDQRALATENAGQWRILEHYRLDPDRRATNGTARLSDLKVSTTDPDAAPMTDGRRSSLGYHDHYVVDGGKARIILAALVTPADVMENSPLPDLLWRVCFRWKLRPYQVTGDATYGTGENIRLIEDSGIRAYVALADYEQSSRFYRQRDFTYNSEQDTYTCPQGTVLRYRGNNYTTRVQTYQAPTETCAVCSVRACCTDSTTGRRLNRHFDEEYRERVRAYQDTPAYQKALGKRKVWVEPLFGEAKDWHGLRRFRLRGLEKVNGEALLVAAGQNLKRLLSWRGWGRRPWPSGAAGLRLTSTYLAASQRHRYEGPAHMSAHSRCRSQRFSTGCDVFATPLLWWHRFCLVCRDGPAGAGGHHEKGDHSGYRWRTLDTLAHHHPTRHPVLANRTDRCMPRSGGHCAAGRSCDNRAAITASASSDDQDDQHQDRQSTRRDARPAPTSSPIAAATRNRAAIVTPLTCDSLRYCFGTAGTLR